MSYLSEALKKYYLKQEGKVIFANKQTLNQLSFQMWEELNFSQIDSSVLSKVINGKRLFTSQQLKVFCKILNLNEKEEEYFRNC